MKWARGWSPAGKITSSTSELPALRRNGEEEEFNEGGMMQVELIEKMEKRAYLQSGIKGREKREKK